MVFLFEALVLMDKEGVKTRAMTEVGKKGGETGSSRKPVVTKPATSVTLEEGEIVTDMENKAPSKKKRKKQQISEPDNMVFKKPYGRSAKRKKVTKTPSPQSSPSIINKKVASQVKKPNVVRSERTHYKIDRMFEWLQEIQTRQEALKGERPRSRSTTKSRSKSRSRSRSKTRSRSRSRSKTRSRDSSKSYRTRSNDSYDLSSTRTSRRSRSSDRNTRKRSRSRREHSISSSSASPFSEQDTIRDRDEEFNIHRARLVLGLAGSTTSDPPVLHRQDQDCLEQRIMSTIADSQPKPSQGPDLSDNVSSLVRALVGKADFTKVMKVCDKYPRPGNVPELVTPELTRDVDKTVDHKVIREDKRLKLDQMCATAATTALGKALDMVLVAKQKNPEWAKVGDIIVDSITLTGFLHSEYNGLRLKGFKQTVNPSYSDIFSAKPDEPEMLMGKAPISEQIKSCEDLRTIKNKLKKQESFQSSNRTNTRKPDFRRRSGFQRNARTQYNRRRYDDRRNRGFSPKRSFPRKQNYNNDKEKTGFHDDRKVSSRRN